MEIKLITDKQRQDRRLGIGGSDIPIIFGLSNYKTPLELYLNKTGAVPLIDSETEIQYWGNQLEPLVIDWFIKKHNVTIEQPDTIIDFARPYLRANVDGIIKDWQAVLEIKTRTGFQPLDELPLNYLLQVAFYCHVADLNKAYVAVFQNHSVKEFVYYRDETIENPLIEKCDEFWSCVQNRIAPKPINQSDLKILYNSLDKSVEANEITYNDFLKLHEINQAIDTLEQDKETTRFNIMSFMKDADTLTFNDKVLATWKANKKGTRTFLTKKIEG